MKKINVVFDWSKAPDGNPQSMALYLYSDNGGAPLRYVFPNATGGEISIPCGSYTALCMNNDNTDWATIKNTGDINAFEIHTLDVQGISLMDLRSTASASAPLQGDKRLVMTPGKLWTDSGEKFTLNQEDIEKTFTMYPQEAGCHYTIDIYEPGNTEYLSEHTLFTTFSGLAAGFHPGSQLSSPENATMPLYMKVSDDGTQIHGEFVNFGECPDVMYKHELKLYSFLSDGTAWQYTYDVTDQAHNAADPRHVHIILRGLPIPNPIANSGGLKPIVKDWLVKHIDVKM